jgi:hypothetical protein
MLYVSKFTIHGAELNMTYKARPLYIGFQSIGSLDKK